MKLPTYIIVRNRNLISVSRKLLGEVVVTLLEFVMEDQEKLGRVRVGCGGGNQNYIVV